MLTGPNVARRILSTRLRCVRRFSVAAVCAKKSDQLPSRPTLPDHDLVHTAVKGSGPGGQKINKTSSAIQMTHLPTGIVVKSQATRSRSQNYTIARRILAEKVDFLERGDDSRVAKKAERAAKKKASAEKKKRRKYRQLSETEHQDLTTLRQRKGDATEPQSPSSGHSTAK